VFGGIGYRFNAWGAVLAGGRCLDYKLKSDSKTEDIDFNDSMIGVMFSCRAATRDFPTK
jgi:hypothetical protein